MRNSLLRIDWHLVTPVIILVILSLTTLLSIDGSFFRSQLFGVVMSIIAFLFFSQIDNAALQVLAKPIYFVSLGLLAVILIIGFESRGAVRWIDIFGVSIQLSEVLKPFLLISFAGFLAHKKVDSFRTFLMTFLLLLPIFFLVFLQPDLGNALIYLIVTGCLMIVFGFPLLWFVVCTIPFLFASPFIWQSLHEYQRQRILTFIQPTRDPLGTSYNVIQAMIAVGSGGLFGRGFSEGTQSRLQFLPENHTDFIFATLSERLGFFGASLVLLCFIYLLYRLYVIFREAEDSYSKLVIAGVFFMTLVHLFVNIGMNMGLLPVVGVTLPFVSSGGSSLLANFIALGFVSSISTSLKKQKVLQIR